MSSLVLGWLPWWLNPFNWLLGRSGQQFINDKPPAYDMNWVFPKLKKTNTRWWSVFSTMTIASVGFLSKMFIGKWFIKLKGEKEREGDILTDHSKQREMICEDGAYCD